jgi:hypothetical protein
MAVVIDGSNTPTAGGVVYGDGTEYASTSAGTSGQVLTSAGSSAPVWATLSPSFTLGTAVTPTGTATVTFTGIPATVKIINLMFSGISFDVGSFPQVRIGDSGGIETTGYESVTSQLNSNTVSSSQSTARFQIGGGTNLAAGNTTSGVLQLVNLTGNTWAAFGTFGSYNATSGLAVLPVGGSKTLSSVLDRIEITNSGGGNFDAGTLNISYF